MPSLPKKPAQKPKTKPSKPRANKAGSSLALAMRRLFLALFALGVLGAAWVAHALYAPIDRKQDRLDVHVSHGLGVRAISRELNAQGLEVAPQWFVLAARLKGADGQLKAGRYEIPAGTSTMGLVDLLSKGQGLLSTVALVEGNTADTLLQRLRAQGDLLDDFPGLNASQIGKQLQLPGEHLEGWIYPDTYKYSPGSKLSELIERAVRLQQAELNAAWAARMANHPVQSPYDLLKLASIVEKETGLAADRPKVASVFVNRLRVGMLLQTDPTVIYGVGAAFDGNLTRKHLQTDTPYNSYTRAGLPPTPIANPGRAALMAAAKPADTPYFYFVAKGDGGSYFSKNLNEHNNAVRKYQLGR
ncbi:endolytic transglycosylase MltG [Limnobacter sp.]|uniref:endolytic transglycosylase MltG n=1 Tax=Limnobacter sp. TaxID=2003368 RepID=UPI0035116BA7